MYSENPKVFRNNPQEGILNRIVFFRYLLTGFFTGLFHIIIHALFLDRFGIPDIATAYAIAGGLSILILPLYTLIPFERKGLKILKTAVPLLALMLSIAICLMLRGEVKDGGLFISFVLLLPLWLLLLADAERVFRTEMLHDRSAARLRSVADTTMITGFLASALIVPGIVSLGASPQTILWLLPLTALLILVFQLWKQSGHGRFKISGKEEEKAEEENSAETENAETVRKGNLLTPWISYYGLTSAITFILFFLFISATALRYAGVTRLLNFLAFFEVVVMVSTLLIRSLLVTAIQRSGSIRMLLLITPVILLAGLSMILITLSGEQLTMSSLSAASVVLFILIAAMTVVSRSFLTALIIPLEGLFRREGKGGRLLSPGGVMSYLITAGIIAVVSSLILLGSSAGDLKISVVISVALIMAVALLRVASLVKRDYRDSLKNMCRETGDIKCDPVRQKLGTSALFYDFIHFNDPATLLSGNEPGELWDDERFSIISIRRGVSHWGYAALPLLRKLSFRGGETVKEMATEGVKTIEKESENRWNSLMPPQQYGQERGTRGSGFAVTPAGSGQRILLTDMIRLMRDPDLHTRRVAILMAGRDRWYDLIPELCDALLIDDLSREAFSVLNQFGERAFRSLAALYNRSATPVKARVLIIRLFAPAGTNEGADFMAEAFFSVHREVRKESLKGLLDYSYNPGREMKERLQVEADRVIDIIAWNTAAASTCTAAEDYEMADFIGTDSEWWYRYLFGVISLIYGRRGVALVCDNINKGDGVSYAEARELIDIIVEGPLRKRLLLLVSVLSGKSSPANLILNAGLEMLPYRQLCSAMINMDYNQVSVWTRSCALRRLYDFGEYNDYRAVAALLFSPFDILREEAARFLREKRVVVWNNTADRIPEYYRNHLDNVVNGGLPESDELFYRTNLLRSCFPQVNPSDLLSLAYHTVRVDPATLNGDQEGPFILVCSAQERENVCKGKLYWREYGTDKLHPDDFAVEDSIDVYILRVESVARELFANPELNYTLVPAMAELMQKSTGKKEISVAGGVL
jgi:hypothetical protein